MTMLAGIMDGLMAPCDHATRLSCFHMVLGNPNTVTMMSEDSITLFQVV